MLRFAFLWIWLLFVLSRCFEAVLMSLPSVAYTSSDFRCRVMSPLFHNNLQWLRYAITSFDQVLRRCYLLASPLESILNAWMLQEFINPHVQSIVDFGLLVLFSPPQLLPLHLTRFSLKMPHQVSHCAWLPFFWHVSPRSSLWSSASSPLNFIRFCCLFILVFFHLVFFAWPSSQIFCRLIERMRFWFLLLLLCILSIFRGIKRHTVCQYWSMLMNLIESWWLKYDWNVKNFQGLLCFASMVVLNRVFSDVVLSFWSIMR